MDSRKNNIHSNSNSFISSTSGANALQVENEQIKETENELLNSMVDENMVVDNLQAGNIKDETTHHSIAGEETALNLEETHEVVQNDYEKSNGLENFELSDTGPQLFNSDSNIEKEIIEENFDQNSDDDELEIPAFLRRQKN